jgi:hypothetical protein
VCLLQAQQQRTLFQSSSPSSSEYELVDSRMLWLLKVLPAVKHICEQIAVHHMLSMPEHNQQTLWLLKVLPALHHTCVHIAVHHMLSMPNCPTNKHCSLYTTGDPALLKHTARVHDTYVGAASSQSYRKS